MPWKEINAMDQKKEFIIHWKSQQFSITELSEIFNISRTTAYKYLDRFAKQGYKGLEEDNRNPHNHPNKTPKEIENAIIELRLKHPRWGAGVIIDILAKSGKYKNLPSATTGNRILKENDLIKKEDAIRK